MDLQLWARVWWTALLVLIALSGAGLAVAAGRPRNPAQRPELTLETIRGDIGAAIAPVDELSGDSE